MKILSLPDNSTARVLDRGGLSAQRHAADAPLPAVDKGIQPLGEVGERATQEPQMGQARTFCLGGPGEGVGLQAFDAQPVVRCLVADPNVVVFIDVDRLEQRLVAQPTVRVVGRLVDVARVRQQGQRVIEVGAGAVIAKGDAVGVLVAFPDQYAEVLQAAAPPRITFTMEASQIALD